MFGGLMKALKAPVKVAQKLPGMGAVSKGVNAAPGVGGMMGKLGLGPSKPPSTVGDALGPINGMGQMAQAGANIGNAVGGMQRPMANSMAPAEMAGPPEQMNQMPPQVGPPPPNTGGPDVNAMMALKQQAAMQNGNPGIGPSFGQQQGPRKMGRNQMRNPRMM